MKCGQTKKINEQIAQYSFVFDVETRGLVKMKKLVELFFNYINYFKECGATEEIFEELKITSIFEFYYTVNHYMMKESKRLAANRQFLDESDSKYIWNAG